MAQTKTRTSGSSSSRSKKTSGAAKRSSASSARGKRTTAARRRSGARSSASRGRSSNGQAPLETVKKTVTGGAESTKEAVTSGAKKAGGAIGTAAEKARGPALAGGAALAGLAGGLAIASRNGGKRVMGVRVPGARRPLVKVKAPRRTRTKGVSKDLMKAAGDIGSAGRQVGELASEVRLVRQQLESSRRKSPVEVVLEGLTSRRAKS